MQLLIKIQIYNKNNNAWQNLYNTPYQPSTDMIGVSGEYGVWYRFCHILFSVYHPLNHKTSHNTWWDLATGDIPKNIDCAEFMRVRFTIDSDWCRMSVWINGELNTNTKIHLTWKCFETKRNIDDVLNELQNIQYNIIIIDCTRG